jgi:hypothetical protein
VAAGADCTANSEAMAEANRMGVCLVGLMVIGRFVEVDSLKLTPLTCTDGLIIILYWRLRGRVIRRASVIATGISVPT